MDDSDFNSSLLDFPFLSSDLSPLFPEFELQLFFFNDVKNKKYLSKYFVYQRKQQQKQHLVKEKQENEEQRLQERCTDDDISKTIDEKCGGEKQNSINIKKRQKVTEYVRNKIEVNWTGLMEKYDNDTLPTLSKNIYLNNYIYFYIFLNPELIYSLNHIKISLMKSLASAWGKRRPRTRNIFSEILYCLSPHTNITLSLNQFGLCINNNNSIAIHRNGNPSKGNNKSGKNDRNNKRTFTEGNKSYTTDDDICIDLVYRKNSNVTEKGVNNNENDSRNNNNHNNNNSNNNDGDATNSSDLLFVVIKHKNNFNQNFPLLPLNLNTFFFSEECNEIIRVHYKNNTNGSATNNRCNSDQDDSNSGAVANSSTRRVHNSSTNEDIFAQKIVGFDSSASQQSSRAEDNGTTTAIYSRKDREVVDRITLKILHSIDGVCTPSRFENIRNLDGIRENFRIEGREEDLHGGIEATITTRLAAKNI